MWHEEFFAIIIYPWPNLVQKNQNCRFKCSCFLNRQVILGLHLLMVFILESLYLQSNQNWRLVEHFETTQHPRSLCGPIEEFN